MEQSLFEHIELLQGSNTYAPSPSHPNINTNLYLYMYIYTYIWNSKEQINIHLLIINW
jgi:hypothetical protein